MSTKKPSLFFINYKYVCSRISPLIVLRKETGRLFSGQCLFPFVYRGITNENFHLDGEIPALNDSLNNIYSGLDISGLRGATRDKSPPAQPKSPQRDNTAEGNPH